VAAEGMQPMRVGRGDQWFPKTRRHSFRTAIRIKEAYVKMAKLDVVETIYLLK